MALDITKILTPQDIENLRTEFDNAALVSLASSNFAGRYAPAEEFLAPLRDRFYSNEDALKWVERERVLIALLATEMSNGELVVHFYWGLMVGLEPSDIAEVLLLVYAYAGANEYNNAIALLEKSLSALKDRCDKGESLETLSCIGAVSAVV